MYILLLATLLGVVPQVTDLSGLQRLHAVQPVVLYVSRTDCTFCKRFERDVLAPLMKSGRFEGQAIFLELTMDAPGKIRDFNGTEATPAQVARRLGVELTPTLLILDSRGQLLAPPKTGYNGNEFYSYYFERAISEAVDLLSGRMPSGR